MAIRAGVIGAGNLGLAHLDSLAAFPDVQIVAVCDRNRDMAEHAAEPVGANVHINFRNLIEEERLDAVFICLPPFALGEPEILAARAGVHVFVERPVALNVQKAREVQKEIEKAGVIASVALPWRYLSGMASLRNRLEGKKAAAFWAWNFMEVPPPGWRRRAEASGGLFMQAGFDLLDAARFLLGEITSVCALSYQGIATATLPEYDIEDASAALLAFRSGAVGQVICCDVTPWEHECGLSIVAEGFQAELTPHALDVSEAGRQTITEHDAPGLTRAHETFLNAVRTGKPKDVRSSYAEAVATLEVALAVCESAASSKMITL